ncbi:uncharacterized protein [Pseudochaenichthys georgianus]|uniref:uncharacterized protein n=1 Tax=Pseudochaenichthys georgianus TaxID=52239 RepID=UPI0039C0C5B6
MQLILFLSNMLVLSVFLFFDQRHITHICDGESPKILTCNSGSYHCLFCIYKGEKYQVENHIKGHSTVKHGEFTIVKCGLSCRKATHYHCFHCSVTIINRAQFLLHLNSHEQKAVTKGHPPPPAQLLPTTRLLAPPPALLLPTSRLLAPPPALLLPTSRLLAPPPALLLPTSHLLAPPAAQLPPTSGLLAPPPAQLPPTSRLLAPPPAQLPPTSRLHPPPPAQLLPTSYLLIPASAQLLSTSQLLLAPCHPAPEKQPQEPQEKHKANQDLKEQSKSKKKLVTCPHCSLKLNKNNYKTHVRRKHKTVSKENVRKEKSK